MMVQYTCRPALYRAHLCIERGGDHLFPRPGKANVSTILPLTVSVSAAAGKTPIWRSSASRLEPAQRCPARTPPTPSPNAHGALRHACATRVFQLSRRRSTVSASPTASPSNCRPKGRPPARRAAGVRDQIVAAAASDPSLLAVRQHLAGYPGAGGIDNGKLQALDTGAARRQQHPQQRVRQHLHQRLYRSQPGEKVYMQGDVRYRAKPEDARPLVCARHQRVRHNATRDARFSRLRVFALDHPGRKTCRAITGCRRSRSPGRGAAGVSSGDDERDGENWRQHSPLGSSYSWSWAVLSRSG